MYVFVDYRLSIIDYFLFLNYYLVNYSGLYILVLITPYDRVIYRKVGKKIYKGKVTEYGQYRLQILYVYQKL